jgi:hypothetical protein
MNVAKVIAALKRAKKYKALLPYHDWDNCVVDIAPDDEFDVAPFLTLFLKSIKAHKVEAMVSRYGHLTLFCPPHFEHVSIYISLPWPQYLLDNVNTGGLVTIRDPDEWEMPLMLQFQVKRVRTKTHSFSLSGIEKNAPYLAKQLTQKIIEQTHKYPQPSTRRSPIQGYCLSMNDVLAVSHYGQAKFKWNNAFAAINRFAKAHYVLESMKFNYRELVIKGGSYFRSEEQSIYLSRRDIALLRKFLPDLSLSEDSTHLIFNLSENAQ